MDRYVLHLLPALPSARPTGSMKSLRACGGFELDIAWADGRLKLATVRSVAGTVKARVRYGGRVDELNLKPGSSKSFG